MRVAVVVINGKIASGAEPDGGRDAIAQMVQALPGTLVSYEVAPEERSEIRTRLLALCAGPADVVLTVGGTGVRPTDWAPEATRDVIEKEVPGIAEAMRFESLKKVRTAMLSRGTAGIRGRAIIINLPGSLSGAKDNLAVVQPVLEHTVEKIRKL